MRSYYTLTRNLFAANAVVEPFAIIRDHTTSAPVSFLHSKGVNARVSTLMLETPLKRLPLLYYSENYQRPNIRRNLLPRFWRQYVVWLMKTLRTQKISSDEKVLRVWWTNMNLRNVSALEYESFREFVDMSIVHHLQEFDLALDDKLKLMTLMPMSVMNMNQRELEEYASIPYVFLERILNTSMELSLPKNGWLFIE